jgi:hypothetical protein
MVVFEVADNLMHALVVLKENGHGVMLTESW